MLSDITSNPWICMTERGNLLRGSKTQAGASIVTILSLPLLLERIAKDIRNLVITIIRLGNVLPYSMLPTSSLLHLSSLDTLLAYITTCIYIYI